MGLKTKEQYIESLRKMNPVVYMFGEKITNVVDNPRIRAGIEATAETYKVAEMPEYRDLVVTKSPLTGEESTDSPFRRPASKTWCARENQPDAGRTLRTCFQRCTGLDCLSARPWSPLTRPKYDELQRTYKNS
jgi:4-hydroxybutyryl-CoA dehydratase/vinylacetyl-CoA-Delta-isomerase